MQSPYPLSTIPLRKPLPEAPLEVLPPERPSKRPRDMRPEGLGNKKSRPNPYVDDPLRLSKPRRTAPPSAGKPFVSGGKPDPKDPYKFTTVFDKKDAGKRDPKAMDDRGDNFDDYFRGHSVAKGKAGQSVGAARKRMKEVADAPLVPEAVKHHLEQADKVAEQISSKIEEVHNLREGAHEVAKTTAELIGAATALRPAAAAAITRGAALVEELGSLITPAALAIGL